jgi:hypothetical protein
VQEKGVWREREREREVVLARILAAERQEKREGCSKHPAIAHKVCRSSREHPPSSTSLTNKAL